MMHVTRGLPVCRVPCALHIAFALPRNVICGSTLCDFGEILSVSNYQLNDISCPLDHFIYTDKFLKRKVHLCSQT